MDAEHRKFGKGIMMRACLCFTCLGPPLGRLWSLGWGDLTVGGWNRMEASSITRLVVGAARRSWVSKCGSFIWLRLPPTMAALRPLNFLFVTVELLTWQGRVLVIVFQQTRRGHMAFYGPAWEVKLSFLLHFICYQGDRKIGLCSRGGNPACQWEEWWRICDVFFKSWHTTSESLRLIEIT